MTPHDARKLLGGYAAGNLTPEERRRLLEAALEDQELFSALAEEEKLRELLSEPAARQGLIRALEPAPRVSWFRRPLAWSLAGSFAAVVIITGVLWRRAVPPAPPPLTVAMVKPTPPPAPAVAPPRPEAPPARRARQDARPAARPPAPAPAEAPPALVARVEEGGLIGVVKPTPPPAPAAPPQPEALLARRARPAARPPTPAPAETPPEAALTLRESEARSGVVGGVIGGFPGSRPTGLMPSADRARPLLDHRLQSTAAGTRVVLVSRVDGEIQVRRRDAEGVWRPILPAGSRLRAGRRFTLPGEFPPGTRLEAEFNAEGAAVKIPITF